MACRKWTKKEDKILAELYPRWIMGEITSNDICQVLRRTDQSWQKRAGRCGLTNIEFDNIDKDYYKKLMKDLKGRVKV